MKEGDIVFFNYRNSKREAKIVKITPTRIQLKFKVKTTGEFRTIWKKKSDNWQIKEDNTEFQINQLESLLKQDHLTLDDRIAINRRIEELRGHE